MAQLENLKVLELASVLAGPGVGQFFAELGAEVVKVENHKTGGDVTRTWKGNGEKTDDRSAYFCSVNWGKKSIGLDLTTKEGRRIVYQLAQVADVVIASYKPGDAEKLEVDYATLSKLNPKLIYGQITGYGSDNTRVGYDAIIQAESGFMSMNGEPGGQSLKIPVALMDVLAGHQLKEALLLALLERTTSGVGKFVEVSLIQAALSSLVNQATNWLVAKKLPQKQGSAHPNIAPYGDVFVTKDGKELLLAIGTDRQFADLCIILGVIFHTNDLYKNNSARVANRRTLIEELKLPVLKFDSKDLLGKIRDAKIPAGLIQSVAEAFEMKEAQAVLLSSDDLTSVRGYVGSPLPAIGSHFPPPPRLGQHTEEILEKSLNYSPQDVHSLRVAGVIS